MTPLDLKSLRQRLGLTQLSMAEAIGITGRMYRYLEAGEYPIRKQTELACAALQAGITEFPPDRAKK